MIEVQLVMSCFWRNPTPSTTVNAEFVKFVNGAAVINGYTGTQERYSLRSGKRLGVSCDFWRLSIESVKMLREMKRRDSKEGIK